MADLSSLQRGSEHETSVHILPPSASRVVSAATPDVDVAVLETMSLFNVKEGEWLRLRGLIAQLVFTPATHEYVFVFASVMTMCRREGTFPPQI